MCTCVAMKTQDVYFGRTMDIDYRFGERVVVTPRNYSFALKNGESFETWYAMVGMASVMDGYPLYAEATNEKGLSIAGLNFPGNAYYGEPVPGRLNLTPYELIPWAMGNFATIAELRRELKNVWLTNQPFAKNLPLAQLHWMISDGEQSLVVEQTRQGLSGRAHQQPGVSFSPNEPKQLYEHQLPAGSKPFFTAGGFKILRTGHGGHGAARGRLSYLPIHPSQFL